jgi:hypothetical protein
VRAESHDPVGATPREDPARFPTAVAAPGGRRCFGPACGDHYRYMDLRKPLLLLAVAGSLVACGDNSDLERGETNCDSTSEQAQNPHDASCEETGSNDGVE